MTHPNDPNHDSAGTSAVLTDLAPDVRELSAEDAQSVRGGLLSSSISSFDGDGKAVKFTDGTSNTITFSWSATQTR